MAHALWNYKRNKARSLSASDAVDTIYFYGLEVIRNLHTMESVGKSRCHLQTASWKEETSRLYTLRAGMYTSLKSNTVMTHDQSNN